MDRLELNEELDQIESVLNAINAVHERIYRAFSRHKVHSEDVTDALNRVNKTLDDVYRELFMQFSNSNQAMKQYGLPLNKEPPKPAA